MTPSLFNIFCAVLGGLGLFLFGMRMLSEGMQAVFSTWIRSAMNALTKNQMVSFLVGLLVTMMIQSSSLTAVMIVGFANTGLMNLIQALAIVLGFNLGSAFSAWLIAIKAGKVAFLLIGIGVPWVLFVKNSRVAQIGKILLALGMIFLGMKTMTHGFVPLLNYEETFQLKQFFSGQKLPSLIASIGVGCLLSYLLKSSLVLVGVAMALSTSGIIGFSAAIAMVLGGNIGATATGVLAAVGANITGRRAALSHCLFNLVTTILIVIFFDHFTTVLDRLFPITSFSVAFRLAGAHTLVNLIGVVVMFPFLTSLEALLTKMIPSRPYKELQKLEPLGGLANMAPSLSIEQAYQEVKKMTAMVQALLSLTKDYVSAKSHEEEVWKKVTKYEKITDNVQSEMVVFLQTLIEARLTKEQSRLVRTYLRMTDELEAVADRCESILEYRKNLFKSGVQLEGEVLNILEVFMDSVIEQFDLVFDFIAGESIFNEEDYENSINKFGGLSKDMRVYYFNSVSQKKLLPEIGLALNEISLEVHDIHYHTTNIVDAFIDEKTL